MAPSLSAYFSNSDLDRITTAVQEAERKTAGEIVPYVVAASDTYEEALWRSGFMFGLLTVLVFLVLRAFTTVWLPAALPQVVLVILLAHAAGMALALLVPAWRRMFAGESLLARRVAQRAAEAFVSEEVFNTRDRTGILIFLSLLEHKVLVVGDAGITAKVAPAAWDGIVQEVVRGMRQGTPAEGLISALQMSGYLLEHHQLPPRPDDRDELSNALRMGGKN